MSKDIIKYVGVEDVFYTYATLKGESYIEDFVCKDERLGTHFVDLVPPPAVVFSKHSKVSIRNFEWRLRFYGLRS